MSQSFSYYVDLASLKLDEAQCWVHALPVGEYQHPLHGKIALSMDRIKRFAASVNDKVRGIDPDIDYDHKARTDEAAGWVKKAEARADGLWLLVDWTTTALGKLKEKAYRYFSPEYVDEWTDNQGNTHQDVIFGGGLTNRPFMKNLVPINLSELTFKEPKEEEGMDPKKLREKLGLKDDATDAEVVAKLDELAALPAKVTALTGDVTKLTESNTGLQKKLDELDDKDAELKKLAETNPAIAKMLKDQEAQATRLAEMEKSWKLAEVDKKLVQLNSGKEFKVTPAANEIVRDLVVKLNEDDAKVVWELYSKIIDGTGVVSLTEIGHSGGQKESDETKKFSDLVDGFMKAGNGKIDYSQALDLAAKADPKAYLAHRDSAYAGR